MAATQIRPEVHLIPQPVAVIPRVRDGAGGNEVDVM